MAKGSRKGRHANDSSNVIPVPNPPIGEPVDSDNLTHAQIRYVDSELNRDYYLKILRHRYIIVVLAAALATLGGPMLTAALFARAKATEIINTLLPKEKLELLDTNIALAMENAKRAETVASAALPIGTVIAWHKALFGIESLPPDGSWAECNGQTVVVDNKPLELPNLNGYVKDQLGSVSDHAGLFLRGGTKSGEFEDDALANHTHDTTESKFLMEGGGPHGVAAQLEPAQRNQGWVGFWTEATTGSVTKNTNIAKETRPKNMSVVWIIRVK